MTPAICAAVKVGTSRSMTDSRGNTSYTVARLSDGHCWMTSNLKLDISQPNTLTSANSDVSSNWPTTTVSTPMETSNGTWSTDQDAILFAKKPVKIFNNGGSYQGSYGYYYTWCAATAGSCKDSSGNTLSSGNASSSICPKGWRLPTGGNSGEFQALYNKWTTATWGANGGVNGRWFGGANTASGGAFFPAAGVIIDPGLNYSSLGGDYWSSTASNSGRASSLFFTSSGANPAYGDDRYIGNSIRCIAR